MTGVMRAAPAFECRGLTYTAIAGPCPKTRVVAWPAGECVICDWGSTRPGHQCCGAGATAGAACFAVHPEIREDSTANARPSCTLMGTNCLQFSATSHGGTLQATKGADIKRSSFTVICIASCFHVLGSARVLELRSASRNALQPKTDALDEASRQWWPSVPPPSLA